MNAVVSADPNHASPARSIATVVFMSVFVIGGIYLVSRALRLMRRGHDSKAVRYTRKH